jgi:hypothetical protein
VHGSKFALIIKILSRNKTLVFNNIEKTAFLGRFFLQKSKDFEISKKSVLSRDNRTKKNMYWTLELVSYLDDAPWPATKDELIDYAIRSGAPLEVIENLQELEDDGEPYESIEEIWSDYPTDEDYFFNEDEL